MIVFLDSCIFVYAAGIDHPYRKPCQEILIAEKQRKIFSYVDTEVLQEILYLGFYKKETDKSLLIVENVIELLDEDSILPVSVKDISRASELLNKYRSIEPRDAVHLAVMKNNNIDIICTADRGIKAIKEITVIDPIDLAERLKK